MRLEVAARSALLSESGHANVPAAVVFLLLGAAALAFFLRAPWLAGRMVRRRSPDRGPTAREIRHVRLIYGSAVLIAVLACLGFLL